MTRPGNSRHLLVWTDTFLRTVRKFLKKHPDLDGVFAEVIRTLERNPFAARLKTHPLKGHLKGKHSVSLTYESRIVLILKLTAKEIILLDIGTHDEVYR